MNEYRNRVKNEQFYLNYFVDFTENDFVEKLVNEINEKSGTISLEDTENKLHDEMMQKIVEKYSIAEDELLEKLDKAGIIKRNNDFKEGGFEYIKSNFPLIFEGINSNKIRKETDQKRKISIRTEKYAELKDLWEKLNEKVILEYKIEKEENFKNLLINFLQDHASSMLQEGLKNKRVKIGIENNLAVTEEEISIHDSEITKISTMSYSDFLKQLSNALKTNIKTLHQSFIDSQLDINQYLNISTIRILKQKFDSYLMYKSFDKFSIEYQKVTNTVHPTKLTDTKGDAKGEISASDVGIFHSDEQVANNYVFDELFYDSDLEKDNIKTNITEVTVFTKIPKNSIKIPVSGGKSYSPDFAYVLNYEDGKKKLYFIVETKNTDEENLREEEVQKIKHAEKFFGDTVKIKFKTQFSDTKMIDLIRELQ